MEDVHLHNPTYGVYFQGSPSAIGRGYIDRLSGQPLTVGVQLDNCEDTMYINDIHFWPYWSLSAVPYTLGSGTAILSYRNDNPMFSNIYAYGYNVALMFGASSYGPTSKFHVVNCDFDSVNYGVYIGGANTTGVLTNFTSQGPTPGGGGTALYTNASGIYIMVDQCAIQYVGWNGARIDTGTSGAVFFDNLWVNGWNQSGVGFPGVENVNANPNVIVRVIHKSVCRI